MQGADLAQSLRCRNDVQMKNDPAALFSVSAPVSGAKPLDLRSGRPRRLLDAPGPAGHVNRAKAELPAGRPGSADQPLSRLVIQHRQVDTVRRASLLGRRADCDPLGTPVLDRDRLADSMEHGAGRAMRSRVASRPAESCQGGSVMLRTYAMQIIAVIRISFADRINFFLQMAGVGWNNAFFFS